MTPQEYAESLHLDYSAKFVPQSRSRNADESQPSLNWRITINGKQFSYMQGIGHIPGYQHTLRKTVADAENEALASERGMFVNKQGQFSRKLPKPKLVDVLYCLISDADALNYASFEEWASEFGYDADSRKAESMYRECLDTALFLRQFIDLDEAREVYQDF